MRDSFSWRRSAFVASAARNMLIGVFVPSSYAENLVADRLQSEILSLPSDPSFENELGMTIITITLNYITMSTPTVSKIYNLMITKGTKTNTGTTMNTVSDPSKNHAALSDLQSGIYYKDEERSYVEIEPSVLTSTKTDRTAQILGSVLLNAKTKASLSDKESTTKIYEGKPSFYFLFDTSFKSNLNTENQRWFGGTRSPKEFVLVKLSTAKNSREIIIGKGNALNSNMGIDEKLIVHFISKKISNGQYEVVPESTLQNGEYCFMFAQGIKDGTSSKVFDFSIRTKKSF